MRDYQQNKVYKWEQKHVPAGPRVSIEHAQAVVNHIWEQQGLQYPPSVTLIHPNTTRWAGTANRMEICLQPIVSTKTIIHEVAHAMTSDLYGESVWHGSLFVGMYSKLLQRHMGMDVFKILQTCVIEGVDIDINATPIFID